MNQRARRAELRRREPRRYRYAVVAVLVPLLLVGMVMALRHEFGQANALGQAATRSYDRRVTGLTLLSRLKDAETAQRGYLLTDDATCLEPYETARRDIATMLADIRPPAPHAAWLASVKRLAGAKFVELDRGIALMQAGRAAAARAQMPRGGSGRPMDQLRDLIGAMVELEARDYARRQSVFLAWQQRQQSIVTAVVIGLVGVLLGSLGLLWRARRLRHDALVATFEAAERHQTILDSTIDAILILGPDGAIDVVNAAATAMLGYPDDDLKGHDIGELIDLAPGHGEFHARIGLVDGVLRRSLLTDRTARHRDGRGIAVDVAMGVMHLPGGDHLVVSLRDIAERKRIERMKDDLMSTVSHEIRTPLTSVIGSLGLLRAGGGGPLPGGAERLVEIAENNSRRLIRLINDMLDIDRIESGKLHLAHDPIDLALVIDRACIGSEGLARDRDVTMHCHAFDRPMMVSGDADRLLQVVTNLLANAIHVSPAGATVELGLAIDGDGRALVTIDDRGPGIPAGFRDRIFGRFERAAGAEGTTGTGLGLAISREIVARHDGRIWFEDRAGGGTRFAFALATIGEAPRRGAATPRVLVCEQDDCHAATLVALVVHEGCDYDLAPTAIDAHAAIARHAYAAVLVDLNFPDGGGLAFARALRAATVPFDAPIVIVSAGAIDDGTGLSPLDVVDVVAKVGTGGSNDDRLKAALRSALARSGTRRPLVLHLGEDPALQAIAAGAVEPAARVVSATNLPAARALLQTVSPDVVILDLHLADGLDLMPFPLDAHGLAIPTIIHAAGQLANDPDHRIEAVLVKARNATPDLKGTVRRVIRARSRASRPIDPISEDAPS